MSRYRFIEVEKVNHAVRTLCRVLQVSRAAYYHWSIHPLSAHASADLVLSERINAIHARSRQTYGAPRVHAELRICGERHSRKRIARLMRRAGIAGRVPRRYRRTTVGDPFTQLPHLVQRDFTPTHPTSSWSATSPTCAPGKAGCISPRSSTASRAAWSAGRWPLTCAPSCC